MRRLSPKRQREARSVKPERVAFLQENPLCWLCGKPSTEIHEIASGPARRKAFQHAETWIATSHLCCHDTLQTWPIAMQYALKLIRDPKHYDRKLCNVLRGRMPNAITADEVETEIPKVAALAYP